MPLLFPASTLGTAYLHLSPPMVQFVPYLAPCNCMVLQGKVLPPMAIDTRLPPIAANDMSLVALGMMHHCFGRHTTGWYHIGGHCMALGGSGD